MLPRAQPVLVGSHAAVAELVQHRVAVGARGRDRDPRGPAPAGCQPQPLALGPVLDEHLRRAACGAVRVPTHGRFLDRGIRRRRCRGRRCLWCSRACRERRAVARGRARGEAGRSDERRDQPCDVVSLCHHAKSVAPAVSGLVELAAVEVVRRALAGVRELEDVHERRAAGGAAERLGRQRRGVDDAPDLAARVVVLGVERQPALGETAERHLDRAGTGVHRADVRRGEPVPVGVRRAADRVPAPGERRDAQPGCGRRCFVGRRAIRRARAGDGWQRERDSGSRKRHDGLRVHTATPGGSVNEYAMPRSGRARHREGDGFTATICCQAAFSRRFRTVPADKRVAYRTHGRHAL